MSASTQHFDLIIAGAGMVGAALAVGASRQGWHVALVDAMPMPLSLAVEQGQGVGDYDLRVSALTEASRQLLVTLGVWPLMQAQRVSPYQHMQVWDAAGVGHIRFSAAEMHWAELGHIVENRVTLAALHDAVARSEVVCFAQRRVRALSLLCDGQRVVTLDDGEQLTGKLVVGADGAQSRIRQLAGLTQCERDYGHHAIVATVATALPHQQTAWQRFMPDGPLALLPLDHPQRCSIVWSTEADHARALLKLDDDGFCAALTEASEHRLGRIEAVSERSSFVLKMRHAWQYYSDGVVVVGDAAHTIHPLAGQGVNLGFKDVAALLLQLAQARQRGQSPAAERWLKAYQRARKGDNWMTMAGMSGFKALFGNKDPGLTLMRNLGLSWVDGLPLLKRQLAARAMGVPAI